MSPYEKLPQRNFWKSGVAQSHAQEIKELYQEKFEISAEAQIATAGSCFAQHIKQRMFANGFSVMDLEPPPLGLPAGRYAAYGFGQFSARYGNIYTVRQLLQLAREAFGQSTPAHLAWQKDGRVVDGLRPAIEPKGFMTAQAMMVHRRSHLAKIRLMLANMDVMVFTFGLTEAWMDVSDGVVYPTAPGTVAEPPQDARFEFRNFSTAETISDFLEFRKLVKGMNPDCRFLLTVSPVPLTATASSQHVLVATTYSKSVLRAAAGELSLSLPDVDYFPSYELISAPAFKGFFFDPNMRTVSQAGVDFVMKTFFDVHRPHQKKTLSQAAATPEMTQFDPACEDALLEAFAK